MLNIYYFNMLERFHPEHFHGNVEMLFSWKCESEKVGFVFLDHAHPSPPVFIPAPSTK